MTVPKLRARNINQEAMYFVSGINYDAETISVVSYQVVRYEQFNADRTYILVEVEE